MFHNRSVLLVAHPLFSCELSRPCIGAAAACAHPRGSAPTLESQQVCGGFGLVHWGLMAQA
ncbi:hypothetical protein PR003_g8928 [Phytophthora rubi]|uniref:Uncharacterized protein n=1 Tax=Phytophthora rubi TaxID=129364 RepID=A0A6A4FPJ9_9STRA|nr:hypothetical protein PR003_g8928 [Phytophthora rubi]